MEQNKIKIKEQDLVLNVGNNVDLSKWDESKYDKFVLILTDDRNIKKKLFMQHYDLCAVINIGILKI